MTGLHYPSGLGWADPKHPVSESAHGGPFVSENVLPAVREGGPSERRSSIRDITNDPGLPPRVCSHCSSEVVGSNCISCGRFARSVSDDVLPAVHAAPQNTSVNNAAHGARFDGGL